MMLDIERPHLDHVNELLYKHEEKYSDQILCEKGKEDAAQGIPTQSQSDPSPFEEELRHEVARVAGKIVAMYKACLELLDARIKAEEAVLNQREGHEMEAHQSIFEMNSDAADNEFALKDAHKRLQTAESRFDEICDKHKRLPVHYIPEWLYYILAFLIFVGEIPLNALVFQIFGENQIMTWVMAFVIGLSVPLTAHFVGIKMREHGNGFHVGNFIKGLLGFSFISAALYGLSIMRTTYLGEFKEELGLTDTLVASSFQFFWLNMAVFMAAIVIAYLSHDAVPGFQRAEHDLQKARKDVAKLEKRRVKLLKSAKSEKTHARKGTHAELREGVGKVIMLKGVYDQVLKEGQQYERQCLKILWRQLAVYRRENQQHRELKEKPESFKKDLEFELELAHMSEKLVNEEERNSHA